MKSWLLRPKKKTKSKFWHLIREEPIEDAIAVEKSKRERLSLGRRPEKEEDEKLKENNEKFTIADKLRNVKNFGEEIGEVNFKALAAVTANASSLHSHKVQVVRSAGSWSLGFRELKCENSILIAYLELIQNSKRLIYIENQFFISNTAGEPIRNRIAEALILRIKRAIDEKERFKVIVVLPLLPGFEGDVIDKAEGAFMRLTLGFEHQTIARGETSLFGQLEMYPEYADYIKFVGLRQHGKLKNGKPATEQVYVHSKMLLVDDDYCLIGSANINDRSMLGYRDSEIGLVVCDATKRKSILAGQEVYVSESVLKLRKDCFNQVFGLSGELNIDPCSPATWEAIVSNTKKNTEIYRKVFGCLPDSLVLNSREAERLTAQANIELYDQLCGQITGLSVEFPTDFLKEEDLRKVGGKIKYGLMIVPLTLFT